jgi:hypothetical protein
VLEQIGNKLGGWPLTARKSRSDRLVDRPRLLAALGECRSALIEARLKMAIGGPLYYSAASVIAAIDGLALLLTGERDYFYLRGHGRKDD